MSEASLARQPIFDRGLKVVGYELLFRSLRASEVGAIDNATATTMVVLNALTEIGLKRIVGTQPAWINASRDFLLSGLAATLPPSAVGLEILENQTIDAALIEVVADLKQRGYRLALDDFQYTEAAEPLLALADVVKLDFIALGREGVARHAAQLEGCGVAVLAEKIETRDDHRYCLEIGCDLFQGFFYRKPELMSDRKIEASRIAILQLIAALYDPEIDFDRLERLIATYVGLTLRLLRYINSAYFGLRHEVASIGQGLALLGAETLKLWATLSVFAGVESKPSELTVTALVRARFCELAGEGLPHTTSSQLFTLGLFSVIDALMDTPIQDVLAEIPFPDDMCQALIDHSGSMGALLDCVGSLEAGEFDHADVLVPGSAARYLDAITWVNEAADGMLCDTGHEAMA
jgi:EAL and modified HD-GYP domain-containing signal transduction protein